MLTNYSRYLLSLMVWRLKDSISSTPLLGKFDKSFLCFGKFKISGVENAVEGVILSMSSVISCSFNISAMEELASPLWKIIFYYSYL